jgi:hypothetical protein
VFAASRRQRAQISSIAPPPGANFKHRAAIGRVLQPIVAIGHQYASFFQVFSSSTC